MYMVVWFSYNQPFSTLLTKYLALKSIDGQSSLFGSLVPKGDVGVVELPVQHQLLFNVADCTALPIAYCVGATHALCATTAQPWLVVVVLDSAPALLDHNGTLTTTHHVAIAIHRQGKPIYYVDVPLIPQGWRYARLVDNLAFSKMDGAQATETSTTPAQLAPTVSSAKHNTPTKMNPNTQPTTSTTDHSTTIQCNRDVIYVTALIAEYALSCQLLMFAPTVAERPTTSTNHTTENRTKLTQLHITNNEMLAAITALVNQRYAQLATT